MPIHCDMGKNTPPEGDKVNMEFKQRVIDARLTFSSKEGEATLKHLKEFFGYAEPSFARGTRTEDAILADGAKHVLSYIDKLLASDPNGEEAR